MGRLDLFIFLKIKTHSWPVYFVDTENVDHVLSLTVANLGKALWK